MILTNKQINKLIKSKPQKVIKYLFELYYEELCMYAYKLHENKDTAEEIVQEVFLYLWEKRESVEIKTSAKSYLLKAVKNKSINFFKTRYAKCSFSEIDHNIIATNTENYSKNNFNELSKLTRQAINSLPERCAVIFKLSRNFNMTYKEIAEHLDISVKTVENQMTIALKRIRMYLDKYWFKNE